MSEAREQILARIRGALADRPAEPRLPPAYRLTGTATPQERVERFAERVADYRARVELTEDP
ncbi:MAG: lactate utilization protein C, partial [Actinobacteria bacterium]|nr:lactate utilization protein C [Actinomycetota bacterium]